MTKPHHYTTKGNNTWQTISSFDTIIFYIPKKNAGFMLGKCMKVDSNNNTAVAAT